MTWLTRRDAILLTTAVAVVSPAVQRTQAADSPPQDNTLLEVPNGVVGSSSIPITLQIPAKTFKGSDGSSYPTKVDIDLSFDSESKFLSITLQTLALQKIDPQDQNKNLPTPADIVVMTRLKIPKKPSETPNGNAAAALVTKALKAVVSLTYADPNKNASKAFQATQNISVQNEDCTLSNVALLRLSLQPNTIGLPFSTSTTVGSGTVVRAVVPAVMPADSRKLQEIKCPNTDNPDFHMTIYEGSYLADEVFVAFSLYPAESSVVPLAWIYSAPTANLNASAYLLVTKPTA